MLTIHEYGTNGGSKWTRPALEAGTGWVKTVDAPDRAMALASAWPKAQIIYRRVAGGSLGDLSGWMRQWPNPIECAETVIRYADIGPRENLWVEGINEPVLNSDEEARWYGAHEAARAKILLSKGLKAVVGNFATGNPTVERFAVWAKAYRDNGGPLYPLAVLGLHEYGHHLYPNDRYTLTYFKKLLGAAPGLVGMRLVITETGLDRVGVGAEPFWKSGLSQDAYWSRMKVYADELRADGRVLAATLFCLGNHPGWQDFEMENADQFMRSLIEDIRPYVAPPPPMTKEKPLFTLPAMQRSFTLYDSVDKVNPRPRTAGYAIDVYEVRGAMWRVTTGQRLYWMDRIPGQEHSVIATALNVRKGPGTSFSVLEVLRQASLFYVVHRENGWAFGYTANVEAGWVSEKYIRVRDQLPPAPPPTQGGKIVSAYNATKAIATKYGVPFPVAWAVVYIEGGGVAFNADGDMLIRFEPHVFRSQLGNDRLWSTYFLTGVGGVASWVGSGHRWRKASPYPWEEVHGTQKQRREVLRLAESLGGDAAYRSISMGAGQVMGFHAQSLGYSTAKKMYGALSSSAEAQVEAMFRFCARRNLLDEMRRGDFYGFALVYNGSGQAQRYADMMASVARANGWR